MRSWEQLESGFRALAPSFQGSRIDLHWGAAGEGWRIAGYRGPAESQFIALARMAGKRLSAFVAAPELEQILRVGDDATAWVQALRHLSGAFEHRSPAQQLHEDGSSAGWIYSGHIHHFAEASANLCLHLETLESQYHGDVRSRLSGARWHGAHAHWTKALRFREDAAQDLPNAAKEAIAALEAVAKVAVDLPAGTLGDCIKVLRREGTVSPPLLKAFESLWGYASESPGVRHGSAQSPRITLSEARFIFATAEAGIHLLLDLRAAA